MVEDYECVEFSGKPALFTNSRIDRESVPKGVFACDLRADESGDPVTIERNVKVNHAGTILTREPLGIGKEDYLYIGDGLNFLGGESTLGQYIADQFGLWPVPQMESILFYSNAELDAELGCIGYLCGDFGRNGDQFWTTWFDHCGDLNTSEFKEDIDTVINGLRDNGLLKDLAYMRNICHANQNTKLNSPMDNHYGFRCDSAGYSYYIRAMLNPGDYNFCCFCYQRSRLKEYLAAARQEEQEARRTNR